MINVHELDDTELEQITGGGYEMPPSSGFIPKRVGNGGILPPECEDCGEDRRLPHESPASELMP